MARATTCTLHGEHLSVDTALEMRVDARFMGDPAPPFRCTSCGSPVRPHKQGRHGAVAHFEHHKRDPHCPLSHPDPYA